MDPDFATTNAALGIESEMQRLITLMDKEHARFEQARIERYRQVYRRLATVAQVRSALVEARNFIGPHHIRSCGKCTRCGKTTPNGTLLICRICVLTEIDQALENLLHL